MKKKNMIKDSRGISLVEIIVVFAILAVLASASTAGWNYISYADTSKCAKEINSLIIRTRVQSMGKKDKPYLFIYRKDNSYYSIVTTADTYSDTFEGSKLANKKIVISYLSGVTPHELSTDGEYIRIAFKKSTGAFDFGTDDYDSITIKGDSTYTIKLYETTGKTKVE